MAIVTEEVTRFSMKDGDLVVFTAVDDVTGTLVDFRFDNTTGVAGEFTAARADGQKWRDRVSVPVGRSRMDVPSDITDVNQLDYFTSPGAAKWS
jgi:hypothetical protein